MISYPQKKTIYDSSSSYSYSCSFSSNFNPSHANVEDYLCHVCYFDNNWISLERKCFCLRISISHPIAHKFYLKNMLDRTSNAKSTSSRQRAASSRQRQTSTLKIEQFGSFAELCAMKFHIFHIICCCFFSCHWHLLHLLLSSDCQTQFVCLFVLFELGSNRVLRQLNYLQTHKTHVEYCGNKQICFDCGWLGDTLWAMLQAFAYPDSRSICLPDMSRVSQLQRSHTKVRNALTTRQHLTFQYCRIETLRLVTRIKKGSSRAEAEADATAAAGFDGVRADNFEYSLKLDILCQPWVDKDRRVPCLTAY